LDTGPLQLAAFDMMVNGAGNLLHKIFPRLMNFAKRQRKTVSPDHGTFVGIGQFDRQGDFLSLDLHLPAN
jgi:hypothetical protein